ncbi:hypothetical protein JAAARDRAFT_153806 [Jaapia argillacea MUCL 33604]|uniref:Fungal-type protein kinase domain-containing protein n=1 Tax=Jaapia argillacea MUCL 33604 TaxID=933084 RepID=A0A067PYH1_9AGAM|nr:hypothetical protein JAAARDRAFT_153806 [Jaapia argillacea MUCL 33604]
MKFDCWEPLMYQSFIDCVANAKASPGHVFAKTDSVYDLDDKGKKKVDVCLFKQADVANSDEKQRPDWSNQVLHVEFKTFNAATAGDPFQDGENQPFESDAKTRFDARGQIISYASELAARQHRTDLFTIMILGTDARLLRWDRAGAAVTERFNYRQDSSLAVFIWRFCHLSMEKQGYDPTATRFDGQDPIIRRALERKLPEHQHYIRNAFREATSSGWPLYKLVVHHQLLRRHEAFARENEAQGESVAGGGEFSRKDSMVETSGEIEHREYIVGKPSFRVEGMTGRATRGYVALDVKTEKFVWLKDVWRIAALHKEGDIIQELNDGEVPNVPTLVCHGDVQGFGQKTWSQKFWKGKREENQMKEHIHYRLVVEEVGRQLHEFRNGLELVEIVRDCLLAHQYAYESLSILHRDVSSGNILIIPERQVIQNGTTGIVWRGMLNDWDLCKKLKKSGEGIVEDSGPRQIFRTGTWAFMSGSLLSNLGKQQILQDDLESFFHVLLYNAVTYLRSNCSNVRAFVADFFDSYYLGVNDECKGGRGKIGAFRIGKILPLDEEPPLTFLPEKTPLNHLLDTLVDWFSHYYTVQARPSQTLTPTPNPEPEDSDWIVSTRDRKRGQPRQVETTYVLPAKRVPFNPNGVTLVVSQREAESLNTHVPMIQLFTASAENRWPIDKLSSDIIKANTKPTRSQGAKRNSEVAELDTGGEPSKRSKASQVASSRPSKISQMKARCSNQHHTEQRMSGRR